ncbi:alkaline phosphatase family protein [Nocardioides cynanchi]|uniref:alkaline phosphatase family protein n=1 Tax=Nocardioides cynanchi TaxID=2558918 RepID=UPI001248E0D9|nr:nucleotide pyrophosphatase/phosphodiesterase family protein [Nocardioides cynanchi]
MTDDFVEPAYGSGSLADVLPSAGAALGAGGPNVLGLPDAPAYVVFLIDGLGSDLLARHAHAAPYLSSLLTGDNTGTAGVPSTTATSLTSLGTGLPPGTHGVVGFTSRVPGSDRLLNALFWDKDVDPVQWQPHPTAFMTLAAAGVSVTTVNKREFRGSGLTLAAQRGGEYVGADRIGERIAAAVTASAASSTGAPALTYLYDGDLDWTGHRYGVASAPWLQQLASIDAEAEQLREALPSSARLVVVADHGMVDSPDDHRIDVDLEPDLRDGVVLLGGEARFRHVYCARGAVTDVAARWTELLGERALVLTRETAIRRGWFGPVSASVLPRLGDVVVACRDDWGIFSSVDFPYELTLVGLHGSLTPAEMRIPLMVD